MIKTQQTRNRGDFPQLGKNIHKKPTANIILYGERLSAFPLRQEKRDILLKVLCSEVRKGIHIGKEEMKLFQFTDDVIASTINNQRIEEKKKSPGTKK